MLQAPGCFLCMGDETLKEDQESVRKWKKEEAEVTIEGSLI